MSKKRFCLSTLIVLCLAVLISGCKTTVSSYIINNGSIKKQDNEIIGQYERFNGYIQYTIKLDAGRLEIKGDSTMKKGSTKVVFMDKDDSELITLENPNNSDDIIELPYKGIYKVKVTGDNHQGSIKLSWSESEEIEK